MSDCPPRVNWDSSLSDVSEIDPRSDNFNAVAHFNQVSIPKLAAQGNRFIHVSPGGKLPQVKSSKAGPSASPSKAPVRQQPRRSSRKQQSQPDPAESPVENDDIPDEAEIVEIAAVDGSQGEHSSSTSGRKRKKSSGSSTKSGAQGRKKKQRQEDRQEGRNDGAGIERESDMKDEVAEEPEKNMMLTAHIEVLCPPPAVKPTRRGGKAPAPTTFLTGPALYSLASPSFESFLIDIAKATPCLRSELVISEMNWRFDGKAKTHAKALATRQGFDAMMSEVRNSIDAGRLQAVRICMPKPQPRLSDLPWATQAGQPALNEEDAYAAAAMNGAQSSTARSVHDQIIALNGSSSTDVKTWKDRLTEKWRIGTEKDYRSRRVYRNHEGTMWELTDIRLQLWASKLASGEVGVTLEIPPASNHFSYDKRLKDKDKDKPEEAEQSPQAIPSSAPFGSYPFPCPPMSSPMGMYPPGYMYSPFGMPPGFMPSMSSAPPQAQFQMPSYTMPMGLPTPSHFRPSTPPRSLQSGEISGPRYITPRTRRRVNISLEQFCTQYSISAIDRQRLEQLEVIPGEARIEKLKEADIKDVGFTTLGWDRFIEANTQFCADVHGGVFDRA